MANESEKQQRRLDHIDSIQRKLMRGTWFRPGRSRSKKELELSGAKKRRLKEALLYLVQALERYKKV